MKNIQPIRKDTTYHMRSAFVLSLVLWITAAMMLLALLFVKFSKEETVVYRQLHNKLLVELETQSLLEKLNFYIATGTFENKTTENSYKNFKKRYLLDATKYNITDQDTNCTFTLLDNSALFNFKVSDYNQYISKIIENCSKKHYPLNDLYLDWIDLDDFSRVNGAEASDYLLEGYNYKPANYSSFQTTDSINLLKGFLSLDHNCTKMIKKHITLYSYSAINIFLIDRTILNALFPDYSEGEIDKLLNLKSYDFNAYRNAFSLFSDDLIDVFPTRVVTINISCMRQGVQAKLKAIIDFTTVNNQSLAVLEIKKY